MDGEADLRRVVAHYRSSPTTAPPPPPLAKSSSWSFSAPTSPAATPAAWGDAPAIVLSQPRGYTKAVYLLNWDWGRQRKIVQERLTAGARAAEAAEAAAEAEEDKRVDSEAMAVLAGGGADALDTEVLF